MCNGSKACDGGNGVVLSIRLAYMPTWHGMKLTWMSLRCASHSLLSSSRSHIGISTKRREGSDMRNALRSLINWRPLESVFADT